MRPTVYWAWLTVAIAGVLVTLSGCGSAGIPADAVVSVNGTPITKTAFHHWMTVAASSSSASPAEKPAVPEPPDYTTCIAHLAKTATKPAKGQSAPTAKQLKSECQTQYKSIQSEVLGFLITSAWTLGEAQSLGIKLSDAQVEKEFTKIKNQQFPKAAEFEKYLTNSGQTVSDLLMRVKLNLLSQKIQNQVVKNKSPVTQAQIKKYYEENKSKYGTPEKRGKPGAQQPLSKVQAAIKEQLTSTVEQQALGKFTKEFKAKWTAKTQCRSSYLVADCSSYKAPKTPSALAATP
jgi:foldase protein PrsA